MTVEWIKIDTIERGQAVGGTENVLCRELWITQRDPKST